MILVNINNTVVDRDQVDGISLLLNVQFQLEMVEQDPNLTKSTVDTICPCAHTHTHFS